MHRLTSGLALRAALCAIGLGASGMAAATSEAGFSPPQSLDDAWWTGPLLAASAATLPRGHWLVEPYVYDLMTYGNFDRAGNLQSAAASHDFASQTYIEYGVVDAFTLGVIPRLGFHESSAGEDSSGFAMGDVTLQGTYRLTQFHQGRLVPATSLVIAETFPTGKYDRLSGPIDGALGSGAYSTTLSLYSQTYFWMRNGRILRTRLDLSYSLSRWASLQGESVYGTSAAFRGDVHPGPTFVGDLGFEYSLTRSWVLAMDINWERDGNTSVAGGYMQSTGTLLLSSSPVQDSGSSERLYLAPAVEYNWNAQMGVIAGVRIAAAGRNVTATVTPVVAINMVF
ncbi:MAG: transporter [Steroidobacteraceae bacterium]